MEKIKFLKLHNAADNSPRVVRDNLIIAAEKGEDCTILSCFDGDLSSQINVYETPEKIMSMSSERFIKLHDFDSNGTTCINVDYIKYVSHTDEMKKEGKGTVIDAFDLSFSVHETPEKVYNYLIKE